MPVLPRSAMRCYSKSSVRLSVRPSIRDVDVLWAYMLTSKVIARIISLGSSLLGDPTSAIKSKGNTPKIQVEWEWGEVFNRKPAISLKWSKIRPRLLLMTKVAYALMKCAKINDLRWPSTAITHSVSKYVRFCVTNALTTKVNFHIPHEANHANDLLWQTVSIALMNSTYATD